MWFCSECSCFYNNLQRVPFLPPADRDQHVIENKQQEGAKEQGQREEFWPRRGLAEYPGRRATLAGSRTLDMRDKPVDRDSVAT